MEVESGAGFGDDDNDEDDDDDDDEDSDAKRRCMSDPIGNDEISDAFLPFPSRIV